MLREDDAPRLERTGQVEPSVASELEVVHQHR